MLTSPQCVASFGVIALLLPAAALLFSALNVIQPVKELPPDEIFLIPLLLSLASILVALPMSLDLFSDRHLPRVELYPRAALLASQFFPSAIHVMCYKLEYSKLYLQTAVACLHFMRLNFLRGALIAPLFRCHYPPRLQHWILPWIVTTFISTASVGYLMPSGLDSFVMGVNGLMLCKFCLCLTQQRQNQQRNEEHTSGVCSAVTCLLAESSLLVSTRLYPEYGCIVGIMLLSAVATNAYYADVKNGRAKHSICAHKSFLRYIAHEIR